MKLGKKKEKKILNGRNKNNAVMGVYRKGNGTGWDYQKWEEFEVWNVGRIDREEQKVLACIFATGRSS
jgi:hypothetical protein